MALPFPEPTGLPGPTGAAGPTSAAPAAASTAVAGADARQRLAGAVESIRATADTWREAAAPVTGPVGAVLGCVSPWGRAVGAAAVALWWCGRTLGWAELVTAATALAVLLLLCSLLTIGRTSLQVTLRVEPGRVTAGESAVAEVRVRNIGRAPLLPVPLDLPAAGTTTRFSLPPLTPDAQFADLVVLPTGRRGVYPVGPATTQRGDPFGLVRRSVTWTAATELFVHPRTVHLDSFGTGLLKDLEGRSTEQVSLSDLAFHALREYAPGDDRRHIHWLSSARRSAATGEDRFMVRQFLDTRRTHLGLVVDCRTPIWLDPAEFETAVEIGASLAVRALLDGMDLTEAGGPHLVTRPGRHTALDLFSRLEPGSTTLQASAARLARGASSVSSVVMITGPLSSFADLRRAAATFSPDVAVLGVRVEHGAPLTLQRSGGLSVLTVGRLADLPRAMAGRVAG